MGNKNSKRVAVSTAAVFSAALLLAGCGGGTGSGGGGGGYGGGGGSTSEAPMETGSGADLGVASTELGDVVVDSKGMTLYYFTKDEKGAATSACTGDCLAKWPIATTTSDEPALDGVTGDVDVIESPEGEMQLTLNGMPLYTFAQDAKPGDTAGHGVGGVWYAISPDGTMIQ
ncbi:COG4315 family predicted lipoprotein [Glutamicibacter sp.]|uniref:COG4315 family predicted lipoprotein n=1 Tax=Glutamicibacter sp. TaxID=1931995 RepID=UPI003D6BC1C3